MTISENNTAALCALEKGLFYKAQNLFKENAKSCDYRTINNLGFFYTENGIEKKTVKLFRDIKSVKDI